MYAKECLAVHFAFDEFGDVLKGLEKPTIVLTKNVALIFFTQSRYVQTLEFFRPKFQV